MAKTASLDVRTFILVPAIALLAGCAGNPTRSYDKEVNRTVTLTRSGNIAQALEDLEKNNAPLSFGKNDKATNSDPGSLGSNKDIL